MQARKIPIIIIVIIVVIIIIIILIIISPIDVTCKLTE